MFRYFICLVMWGLAAQLQAQPVNDMRTNATIIAGTNLVITSSNEGATRESSDPLMIEEDSFDVGETTVWWRWTPNFNGEAAIATGLAGGNSEQNSTFDTQLGVYVAEASGLREIASSEDAGDLELLSQVTFIAEAGITYFIMVSGFEGETGTIRVYLDQTALATYTLELGLNPFNSGALGASPSSPDGIYDKGTAVALTATPASGFEFDRWTGDIQSTNNPVQLTIDSNTQVTAIFKSLTQGFGLNVAVIGTGTVTFDTPPNAANGTYAPNTRVILTAGPGENFRFDLWSGSITTTNNPLSLLVNSNINLTARFSTTLPPENDHFENATLLEGTNIIAAGNNNNATMQSPPEPLAIEFTPSSGHSVWWRWIAPLSGRTTVSTGVPGGLPAQQSTFDTLLGIYTGPSRSNLTHIASSDDAEEFPSGSRLSLINFNAVAGQTYHILVDSYTNVTGQINLYITNSTALPEPPSLSISREAERILIQSSGAPGAIHTLQASSDLVNWQFYSFITNNAGPVADSRLNSSWQFYRIRD